MKIDFKYHSNLKFRIPYFYFRYQRGSCETENAKKAGTIKPNQDDEKSSPTKSSEEQGDNGDQKSKKEQKEADLVERIAVVSF
jgi:hypothetical protein